MATSANAQIGSGVDLKYWDTGASPPIWTALGKIRSIAGVGVNKPEVDSTTLDSTAVERIAGLADGKQMTIVLTTTSSVMTLFEAQIGNALDFKLTAPAPASTSRYFTAVLLDYDHGTITPNGLMEFTVQARLTSSPTATPSHS